MFGYIWAYFIKRAQQIKDRMSLNMQGMILETSRMTGETPNMQPD